MFGKTDWFFPDAELPPRGTNPELPGHESVIILNPNDMDAEITVTFHYTDRAPEVAARYVCEAGRIRCDKVMEPNGFFTTPVTVGEQYAMSIHSTVPVVCQYGRLDMRSGPMAFYTTPGYAE